MSYQAVALILIIIAHAENVIPQILYFLLLALILMRRIGVLPTAPRLLSLVFVEVLGLLLVFLFSGNYSVEYGTLRQVPTF